MTPDHRIFLSFAKSDAETAARIRADLTAQGFEVWEYATSWKKEDLRLTIPEPCAELIQRASWFIPIVSAASVNPSSGRYMVMEVEYASELGLIKQNRVLPLLLTASKPKKWLKPFDLLMPLGVIKVDPADDRDYLQKIARLCRQMNIVYRPIIKHRPWLPFWKGFVDEVTGIRKQYPDVWNLMPVLTEFDRCCGRKEWHRARKLVSFYNDSVSYLAGGDPGTPQSLLAQAYCDCITNHPESAERLLKQAAEALPDFASIHGTVARLHLLRKEPYQAREHLVAALARCSAESLRERMYYLSPMVELGEPIPEDDRSLVLTTDVTDWEDDEQMAVYGVRSNVLYQTARYKPATDLLDIARSTGLHSTTTVLYAHRSWLKLERPGEAEMVLIRAIDECGSNSNLDCSELNFQLAEFYLSIDQVGKMLTIYEKVLTAPEKVTRKFAVRYARILRELGDEKRTRTECLQMLGGRFPLPSTYEDFYYDGFANYLLGNSERARYDFERSRQFDTWYPRVREPACHVPI
jgi:tetratricopeptide (TPR) repeat protein